MISKDKLTRSLNLTRTAGERMLPSAMLRPAVRKSAAGQLDHTHIEFAGHGDLRGVQDADFVTLGLGATSMLAMLWSVAMGKRTVGVELRGDPSLGIHWN